MRLQLRSSLVKPAKKVIGKQRLTVLVNVSFPAPDSLRKKQRHNPACGVLFCRRLEKAPGLRQSGAVAIGLVAEWLCSGLQIRVRRFNSDPGLQYQEDATASSMRE